MNPFISRNKNYSKLVRERIEFYEDIYKRNNQNIEVKANTKQKTNKTNNVTIIPTISQETSSFTNLEIKNNDMVVFDELEKKVNDIHITNNNTIGLIGGKKIKQENKEDNTDPLEEKIRELETYFNINNDLIIEPSFIPSSNINIIDPIKSKLDNEKPIISKKPFSFTNSRFIKKENTETDTIRKKYKYCGQCKLIFRTDDEYKEHMDKHNNTSENTVCMCKKCGKVFQNDDEYYLHKNECKRKKSDEDNTVNQNNIESIPESLYGAYPCPVCQKKYDNSFYLGEHFILAHDDYSVLCRLDEKTHNGFPGYKLLYKIGMVKKFRLNKENITEEKCDICFFNYTYNKKEISNSEYKEDILPDNRNPIILSCCKRLTCHDCLMQHIITTDSIICPFCRKDHTRDDLKYIIYVDIINKTDRQKWLPWWENHMEIFLDYTRYN